jgi:Fic family protein
MMTWIHELEEWPNFTWDMGLLASKLAETRHRQGLLLGRMAGLGFDLRSEANLATLIKDVVKSSAIEGEKLDEREVRSSIARKLGLDLGGLIPVGRDVDGVVEMMVDATTNYSEELTIERLFGWHASLFPMGRSGMHKITVGAWRPESAGAMQVVSGPLGRETVHFAAPAAPRLEGEMKTFLSWFASSRDVDPVIKAALAHLWFVTIHPFEDGNGRIARAIADMALARSDGMPDRFYSMSSQIELERKNYYSQLERQQKKGIDATEWLEWFLSCLSRSIETAETSLEAVLYKAKLWEKVNSNPVNERQRKVLNRMLDGFKGYMNTSKYAKLAKTSPDSALRDIKDLVARGIFIQNSGGGRSTSYRLVATEELC